MSGRYPTSKPIGAPKSRCRVWTMRLGAVLLGLSFFVAAEAVCWMFGVGEPDAHEDPYVGFSELQPLFVREKHGQRYQIAPARLKFFAPDSFPAIKTSGTFRIFCLGGSTVQGRPFSKQTSFTTWLRLALQAADPTTNWEVVNCGGVSYASYRLVPIMLECLAYEPDLLIVCTGHNEFLEDRTYRDLREQPSLIRVPHQYLARLRSYHVYRNLLLSATGKNTAPPLQSTLEPDVDALLDYNRGLRAYRRDAAWREGVIRHFNANLHRMARIASDRDLPVLLIHPPANLADSPPFKSEHRTGLSNADRAEFNRLVAQARRQQSADRTQAAALLEQAKQVDPQYAGVRFHLGKLYESQGQIEAARGEFLAAREHDICPLRIVQPMEAALRRVAAHYALPLVDAHALLAARTRHGILDGSMLVDHVHPTFEGHQLIALALVETMADQRFLTPQADWQAASREAFERHLDALRTLYFLKGEQTLAALRAWTKGQADGPPIESRLPERFRTPED